jgi:hypothetical protein
MFQMIRALLFEWTHSRSMGQNEERVVSAPTRPQLLLAGDSLTQRAHSESDPARPTCVGTLTSWAQTLIERLEML